MVSSCRDVHVDSMGLVNGDEHIFSRILSSLEIVLNLFSFEKENDTVVNFDEKLPRTTPL